MSKDILAIQCLSSGIVPPDPTRFVSEHPFWFVSIQHRPQTAPFIGPAERSHQRVVRSNSDASFRSRLNEGPRRLEAV
jgi:hypothetical protein